MQTRLLQGNNPDHVALAGEILRRGGVVAIPTETVYGLAANALDAGAAARIFAAKGRPADNPLIVHIGQLGQLGRVWRQVPPLALLLAEAFWPGPLTLVLPKADGVPAAVTGGLETVGVRLPGHPVARSIIEAAGVPLAAPSANLSGRPSATTADHVLEDFSGRIDAVVDGGPCPVGVESTVVDLTGPTPVVLRPGAITAQMIAAVAGAAEAPGPHAPGGAPRSPGMKYRHYATRAPLTLYTGAPEDTAAALLALPPAPGRAVLCFDEYEPDLARQPGPARLYSLGPSWDAPEHARRLFGLLREIDRSGAAAVVAQAPRAPGRGAATFDRLSRAAAGQVVPCTRPVILGVTGRSGTGKSLLSAHLAGRGALSLDADALYARLLQEDPGLRAAIVARFPQAAGAEGGIDRRALAGAVFGDRAALADLSAITHPAVARALRARLKAAQAPLVVLDVPVLFGSGIDRLCTATVGLLAGLEPSAARIMARDGIDRAAALRRLKAQQEEGFFRQRCDFILENTGDLPDFMIKIQALTAQLGF